MDSHGGGEVGKKKTSFLWLPHTLFFFVWEGILNPQSMWKGKEKEGKDFEKNEKIRDETLAGRKVTDTEFHLWKSSICKTEEYRSCVKIRLITRPRERCSRRAIKNKKHKELLKHNNIIFSETNSDTFFQCLLLYYFCFHSKPWSTDRERTKIGKQPVENTQRTFASEHNCVAFFPNVSCYSYFRFIQNHGLQTENEPK